MIQKLNHEIPHKILELMPGGIPKNAVPDFLREAGPIVPGVVGQAVKFTEKPVKEKEKPKDEPEGLGHHLWR